MPQSPHRHHWQLAENTVFLNHGSFGATPTVVLNAQRALQDALEKEPIRFLAVERELEPKLDKVREILANLIGADSQDVAFVRNATDGVNAVLRSFPFVAGDEIVITNHGYNACSNAARFVADGFGGTVRIAKVPFPLLDPTEVVDAVVGEFTDKTRLLLIDHITSPTGLVLPLAKLIAAAKERGIRVLVDGAHAPGQVPVDLRQLGADYYTANHHKWLCGPKASGFLWVRRDLQSEVRPTVISHGHNHDRPGRSKFLTEFDWIGTYDPCPILAMEASIEFLSSLKPGGISELMESNHSLALQARELLIDRLGLTPPAPAEMIASLVSLPIIETDKPEPAGGIDAIQQQLFDRFQIEVPIFFGTDSRIVRTSSHAYNHIGDYEQLADALAELI